MITYVERQLALLPDNIKPVVENPDNLSRREWGTFKDSLKAPIHRWFTYPAGFSYKAVEYSLKTYGVTKGQTVYDPFMGSGTTNVVAKTIGINSYGVEAHPFIKNSTEYPSACWRDESGFVRTLVRGVRCPPACWGVIHF